MSANSLQTEIARILNLASRENATGTPDFILSTYLVSCLAAFEVAVQHRAEWRGESIELPALQGLVNGDDPR